MRVLRKNRESRGFSLAELLIVVAIIGILLAVAVPNVLSYYRELKITELDDDARTIFLAAQNQLTALAKSGEKLDSIGANIPTGRSTGAAPKLNYVEYQAAAASTTPTEPSATGLRKILPGGAVDTQFHKYNYIIEFDTESGAVYGVWYWESDGFEYGRDATTTNQDKNNRLQNGLMVGFYGGETIDRLQFHQLPYPTVKLINAEELRLEITVPEIDGASDDFTITVSAGDVVLLEDAKLQKNNKGTVVLDTLKVTNAYSETINALKEQIKNNTGWTVGMKYKKWREALGEKLPLPGDDITLTVRMSYTGKIGDNPLTPSTLVVTGNTLFEKVEGDTAYIAYGRHLQNLHDSGTHTGTGDYCSGVLKNTSIIKAKQTKDINFSLTNTSEPVKSWASTYEDLTETGDHEDKVLDFHPVNNTQLTEYDGDNFEIRNMNAGHYQYGGVFSYIKDGTYKNIVIVNPHVHAEGEASDVGFDPARAQKLTAGALAGAVIGDVTIDNCRAYNDFDSVKDAETEVATLFARDFDLDALVMYNNRINTGGISPEEKENIQEGFYVKRLLGLPHVGAPASGSESGGLVGIVLAPNNSGDVVMIKNSFASVINIGAKNVGGLVGVSKGNLTIESSYSASYVFGNRNVAGLIGNVENPGSTTTTINNSYAAGEIVSGYVKGFKGAGLFHYDGEASATAIPTTIKVSDSYAAVRYNGDGVNGQPRRSDESERTGSTNLKIVGYIYGTFKLDDQNYYVQQNGIEYGLDCQGKTINGAGGVVVEKTTNPDYWNPSACGTKASQSDLVTKLSGITGSSWSTPATSANTHPYTLLTETKTLEGEAYPYPMLKSMPHYGDWLEEKETPAASLCYYEKYGVNDFGVWGYVTEKTTGNQIKLNSLKPGDPGKGPYAIEDGYCVAVEDGANLIPPETITVGTETYKVDTATSLGRVKDSAGTKTYDLYQITGLDAITVGTDYYYHATVGGQQYWFNPFFACEVLKDEPTDKNTPQAKAGAAGFDSTSTDDYAGQVVIRTARQLANLAAQTGSKADDTKTAQLYAYTQLLDIDYKKYDGSIKGKNGGTDAQSPAALSGAGSYNGNSFIIKNLFIQGDSKTGLFGELSLSGTQGVRNVFLVDVTVNGKDTVGALVGSAASSTVIDNCGVYASSAENYKTHSVTGNTTVGGLIGMIGSSTTVQNSFAAVQVTGNTAVGGFVGQINGNNTANGRYLKDCYAGGFTESGKYEASSANVTANDTNGIAGGFVGKLMNYSSDNAGKKTYKGLNFQGTIYSTCSVKGATVGLFAGSTSDYFDTAGRTPDPGEQKLTDSLTATDLTLYATGEAFNATARPETYLKTGSDVPKAVGDGVTAYPYDGTLKDTGLDTGTYPYQTDLDEHHGDWAKVSVPVPEMMMAYIEEYVTGGQGVYALKYDGTNPPTIVENSLQPDKVVKDDYYRILSTTELTGATAILDTNSANLQPETNVEIGSVSYYAYTLGTGWDSPANYYHTVTLTPTGGDEQTYLYNPSFACEAFDVTE